MWLCVLSGKQYEDSFENTQRRKTKQMQLMWLCIFTGRPFEDTSESKRRRKVKQMQTMQLCLFSGKRFEDTFENSQWRKVKKMQPMWLYLLSCRPFDRTFQNAHSGENTWNQCEFACNFEDIHENAWLSRKIYNLPIQLQIQDWLSNQDTWSFLVWYAVILSACT